MNNITKDNEKNLDSLLFFLNGISEKDRKKFFYNNRDNMDTLVWYYCNEFTNEFYKDQNEAIKGYCKQIRTKTKTDKWQIHTGRVLYIYYKGKIDEPRIGIECVFEKESYKYPLGTFHIYIATWAKFDIKPYEKELKEAFPDRDIDEDKTARDRAFLFVEKYKPEETEEIIDKLEETYNTLKKIIDNHKK